MIPETYLVDVVHQDSFVFEHVTFGFHVQGVVAEVMKHKWYEWIG
jgi:hypothetical protein